MNSLVLEGHSGKNPTSSHALTRPPINNPTEESSQSYWDPIPVVLEKEERRRIQSEKPETPNPKALKTETLNPKIRKPYLKP